MYIFYNPMGATLYAAVYVSLSSFCSVTAFGSSIISDLGGGFHRKVSDVEAVCLMAHGAHWCLLVVGGMTARLQRPAFLNTVHTVVVGLDQSLSEESSSSCQGHKEGPLASSLAVCLALHHIIYIYIYWLSRQVGHHVRYIPP